MFLTGDLKYNFFTYRIATLFGVLPYEFDPIGLRLKLRSRTDVRWTIHMLVKLFVWTRFVVGAAIFARSLTKRPKEAHYPYTSTVGYLAIGIMIYEDFICSVLCPQYVVLIFNEVIKVIPAGESRWWRIRRRKKVENMTVFVPFLFLAIGTFIIAPAYFIDSASPLFSISIVQEWWDTGEMLMLLFCIDMAFFSIILICMVNSVFIVMIFIHHVNLDLGKQLVQLSRLKMKSTLLSRVRLLRFVVAHMSELRIKIQCFNLAFALLVFSTKVLCILCAFSGMFAAIQFRMKHPMLSISGSYLAFLAFLFYPLVYDQAFSVPEKMGRIKYVFRKESTDLVFRYKKKEFRVLSQTIWVRGIQVGGFGTFERASTLLFFHFVFQYVSTALVGADI